MIGRAEKQFAEERARNPKTTLPKTVARLAAAVHQAVKKRDGIAAVFAAQCAHLATKVDIDFVKT